MLDLLDGETVKILVKAATDWAGDYIPGPDDDTPDRAGFTFSHYVDDVLFADGSMDTDNDRRDDFEVTGQVYMPLGSVVSATDRIERADGTIVRILGRPKPVELGLVSGIVFRFREVNGGGS